MRCNLERTIETGHQWIHSPTREGEAFNAAADVAVAVVVVLDGLAAIRTEVGPEAIVDSIAPLSFLFPLSMSPSLRS